MLHGTRVRYVNVLQKGVTSEPNKTAWPRDNDNLTLLHMIRVVFKNGVVSTVFLDDGSTATLITHQLAGFLGLKGISMTQYM